MLTVAYLANEFPSPVEPYVGQEIAELRGGGVRVVAGSVRRPKCSSAGSPEIVVARPPIHAIVQGFWLVLMRWRQIKPLIRRACLHGSEGIRRRLKALVHTLLGACYAAALARRNVDHIHVHHGYVGSWIAMTAARLLGVQFSMTLHGSDLLLDGHYLDLKLKYCGFCITVSEYNRNFIRTRYPEIPLGKILVSRLGVRVEEKSQSTVKPLKHGLFTILSVGRLHPVKDHRFLVQACRQLHAQGLKFRCLIAGEGPERPHLECLIKKNGLLANVILLGHVPCEQMNSWYDRADVVVLTSRSEGIPLVLMEAMAREKLVLAPAITGIPELVIHGKTGLLYAPGSMQDFVAQLKWIYAIHRPELSSDQSGYPDALDAKADAERMRYAAWARVSQSYNQEKNLAAFADLFLRQVTPSTEGSLNEDFVLQQI